MNPYRLLTYSIVVIVLILGVRVAYEDYENILNSILLIGWAGFAFVCSFSLINYLVRYLRWIILLRHLGDRFAFVDGLLCYVAGFALTITPGKGGEAIRSLYFYRRHKIQHKHTLAALLAERSGDALASMLLAIIAIYTFENLRWLAMGFTTTLLLVVLLVRRPEFLLRMVKSLGVIKIKHFQRLLDLFSVSLERAKDLFSLRILGMVTIVGLLSWSAEAFAFAWLAHQLHGPASTLLYMSIFAIAMIAGAATFLPGGLGSTEAVMYLLLKLTGVGDAEAFTIALVSRLATLWLAVILGLISMLWLEKYPHRNEPSPAAQL